MAITKGEATRQRIIEVAAPIFNRRGYVGCSLSELMEATGMEKGGIYRHFASKEELAAEAFRYALAKNVKVRTAHLEEIPGAVAKLRRAVEIFAEDPSAVDGGCPLMNTAIDADDGNPVLRQLALKGIQDWRARLCRIVQAGMRNGEIRSDVVPQQVANNVMAALEGALMITRLEKQKHALRDARAMLGGMLDGISTPPVTQ